MELLLLLNLVAGALAVPFIIGGEDAAVGEYPWQGSLLYNGGHTCGCTLIGDKWALTAAHCTYGYPNAENYEAWFGVHDRSVEPEQGVKYQVVVINEHPGYIHSSFETYPNDLCIVELEEIVDESDPNVQRVPVSGREVDYPHEGCAISGWGRTTSGYPILPDVLQKAEVNVISNQECLVRWFSWEIRDDHICIMGENEDIAACNGDSGGPLVCEDPFELCGITSWGDSNCGPDRPSVYQRVSHNCEWIEEISGVQCT